MVRAWCVCLDFLIWVLSTFLFPVFFSYQCWPLILHIHLQFKHFVTCVLLQYEGFNINDMKCKYLLERKELFSNRTCEAWRWEQGFIFCKSFSERIYSYSYMLSFPLSCRWTRASVNKSYSYDGWASIFWIEFDPLLSGYFQWPRPSKK